MFTKEMLLDYLGKDFIETGKLEDIILKDVSEEYKEKFLRGVYASNTYTTYPFNDVMSEEDRSNTEIMYPLIAYDPWLYRNASIDIKKDI